jgi:pilus assembly protein CpaC
LDFVPYVLGNGRVLLDLYASISEPDPTNSSGGVPSLKGREVDTRVELRAGQTLAIAGLLEQRVEASNSGLPWLSEIPYVGAAFSSKSYETNEVELLVLVTPEIADGMDPGQVPTCRPGLETTDPSDWELFFKGYLEVPNCCPKEPAVCQVPTGYPPAGGGAGLTPVEGSLGRQNPQNPPGENQMAMNPQPPEPGFIGPVGYDVLK